jgi:MFS family permease
MGTYVLCAVTIVVLLTIAIFMHRKPVIPASVLSAQKSQAAQASSTPNSVPSLPNLPSNGSLSPPELLAPVIFVVLNGFCRGILAIVETFGAKLYGHVMKDPKNSNEAEQSGIYFSILGAVGVIIYLFLPKLTKFFSEKTVLLCGVTLPALGLLCIVAVPTTSANLFSMTVGIGSIWSLGGPTAQTLSVSELSKYLKLRPQGRWMGLITAAGSVGRIVLPLGAGLCYSMATEQEAWAFCLACCWISLGLYYLGVFNTKPLMRALRGFKQFSRGREDKQKLLANSSNAKDSEAMSYASTAE